LRRGAFSLIEITVVLLIAAIAAAAVTLRVRAPLRRARMKDLVGQIAAFDRLTRAYAGEHDRPLRLVVDMAGRQLRRTDERATEALGRPLELPSGWTIGRLLIGGRDVTAASAAISFSRRGLSRSYALLIEHEAGPKQWILLAGLTGELIEADDEDRIRDILAAVGPRRDAG